MALGTPYIRTATRFVDYTDRVLPTEAQDPKAILHKALEHLHQRTAGSKEPAAFYILETEHHLIYALKADNACFTEDQRLLTDHVGRKIGGTYAYVLQKPLSAEERAIKPSLEHFRPLFRQYIAPLPEPEEQEQQRLQVIFEAVNALVTDETISTPEQLIERVKGYLHPLLQSESANVTSDIEKMLQELDGLPKTTTEETRQGIKRLQGIHLLDVDIVRVIASPAQEIPAFHQTETTHSAVLVDLGMFPEIKPSPPPPKRPSLLQWGGIGTGLIASLAAIIQPFGDRSDPSQQANLWVRALGVIGLGASLLTPILIHSSQKEQQRSADRQPERNG